MKKRILTAVLVSALITSTLTLTALCSAPATPMSTADASAAHSMQTPMQDIGTNAIPEPIEIIKTEVITECYGLVEGSTLCGIATAYCGCADCCGTATGICAMGRKVRVGDVACNWLPLGSVIEINGKEYTVADRGSVYRFNKIGRVDIYFDTHEEACRWGKRDIDIKIVSIGGNK